MSDPSTVDFPLLGFSEGKQISSKWGNHKANTWKITKRADFFVGVLSYDVPLVGARCWVVDHPNISKQQLDQFSKLKPVRLSIQKHWFSEALRKVTSPPVGSSHLFGPSLIQIQWHHNSIPLVFLPMKIRWHQSKWIDVLTGKSAGHHGDFPIGMPPELFWGGLLLSAAARCLANASDPAARKLLVPRNFQRLLGDDGDWPGFGDRMGFSTGFYGDWSG